MRVRTCYFHVVLQFFATPREMRAVFVFYLTDRSLVSCRHYSCTRTPSANLIRPWPDDRDFLPRACHPKTWLPALITHRTWLFPHHGNCPHVPEITLKKRHFKNFEISLFFFLAKVIHTRDFRSLILRTWDQFKQVERSQ